MREKTESLTLAPVTKLYAQVCTALLLILYAAALLLYRFAGQWFDYQTALFFSEHLATGLRGAVLFYSIGLVLLEKNGA
jgi:hypothetical protein